MSARILLPLLLCGCTSSRPIAGPSDLGTAPPRDLASPSPDLAVEPVDLAVPARDLASAPDLFACKTKNPAGCKQTGCPKGQQCAPIGCTSSQCNCDAQSGTWVCTRDCGGGTCVPDGDGGAPDAGSACGPNPAGCKVTGCPPGQKCDPTVGCKPSACGCDPQTKQWICTGDCGGGTCV